MNRLNIVTIVSLFISICTEASLKADPDFFRSSIAITSEKTPRVTIADKIVLDWFSIGGLVEIRNENRFNQEIFPNHNWRGVIRTEFSLYIPEPGKRGFTFLTGLSHESAHPTMGIAVETDKAYEMIYDKSYRWMVLNAVNAGSRHFSFFAKGTLSAEAFYHYYFMSKNTPELAVGTLTHGHGISGGIQWEYPFGKNSEVYLSGFGRCIFDSRKNTFGEIYFQDGLMPVQRESHYPVIRHTGTLSVKAGVNRSIRNSGVRTGFFTRFLYGNPFGFIDSREKRKVVSAGFEIFR
ncbi:MAG: hypothetical protein GX556_13530 [Fibrobacter sp.]|nr:hypothetical protein [Fibrobacter sp.]